MSETLMDDIVQGWESKSQIPRLERTVAAGIAILFEKVAEAHEPEWRHLIIRMFAAMSRAYDEGMSETGWQPIETKNDDEMCIYYQKHEDGRRSVGLAYKARDGGWRDSEGNWHERLEPTHWMPLPPPPSGA